MEGAVGGSGIGGVRVVVGMGLVYTRRRQNAMGAGMGERGVLTPGSVAEVQAAVREARAAGSRLRVVGARSLERFGQPLADGWELVSTGRLGSD